MMNKAFRSILITSNKRGSPTLFQSSFASTSTASAEPTPTPASTSSSSDAVAAVAVEEAAAEEPILDPSRGSAKGKGFVAWLSGDGGKYKNGLAGKTNWIGDTPFPMNPTFSPLPPLADSIKTKIYNAYLHNLMELPSSTDSQIVRAVSSRFGVGMERVRAIIRLKELEKAWKTEKRPLQTELLKGMESHLGVTKLPDNWKGSEEPDAPIEIRGSNKTIFEMIDVEAGDSPVFLPLLSRLPTPVPRNPLSSKNEPRVNLVPATRPGRASTKFSDLSGTFKGRELESSRDPNKTKRGNKSKPKPVTVE